MPFDNVNLYEIKFEKNKYPEIAMSLYNVSNIYIPEELIVKIFSFCPEEISTILQICPHWNRIATQRIPLVTVKLHDYVVASMYLTSDTGEKRKTLLIGRVQKNDPQSPRITLRIPQRDSLVQGKSIYVHAAYRAGTLFHITDIKNKFSVGKRAILYKVSDESFCRFTERNRVFDLGERQLLKISIDQVCSAFPTVDPGVLTVRCPADLEQNSSFNDSPNGLIGFINNIFQVIYYLSGRRQEITEYDMEKKIVDIDDIGTLSLGQAVAISVNPTIDALIDRLEMLARTLFREHTFSG
jgi:hypothetical protein